MKKIVAVIILCSLQSILFGQSQDLLNKEAKMQFDISDKELNRVYRNILQEYKVDTIFIRSLKEAQRQWMKFRDAQVKMKYPPYKSSEGSMTPMCIFNYLTELTNKRIEELKQWIDGVEEGDVCSGSIKNKE